MQTEKINIHDGNHSITGIFSNFGTNRPLVILSHGFASSKENTTYTIMESLLKDFEISSFRYDFFGHGESEGKLEDITTTRSIQNLKGAYRHFRDRSYSKIGLVGSSFGGFISMLCAPDWKDLLFLALKCPVSDFELVQRQRRTPEELEDWKKKGFIQYKLGQDYEFKINYSFFEDLQKHNGYTRAPEIQTPTLIVHGTADESVPYVQSEKLQSMISSARLESIPGADHRFSDNQHFDRMVSMIMEFIIKNAK